MNLSVPGLIGAAAGLLIGIVDYLVVAGIVGARLGRLPPDAPREARQAREAQVAWIKRVLFLATIVVFPLIGYWIGATIGG